MKILPFLLLSILVIPSQFLIGVNTFAYGEGSISKEDACTLQDGLSQAPLTIKNYSGYSTRVGSYYKDKKMLYYVVDAKSIRGGGYEAFMWSWDCTKKKSKQLSTYNFAGYQSSETNIDKEYSWINDYETIKIVFADKDHIIVKQARIYKGPKPEDKYLVFYRSNKTVGENFSLEKFNGFQKFKETILNKSTEVACNMSMDKSCTFENPKVRNIVVKKMQGFRFYLDNIYSSNGSTYLSVGYRDASGYTCTPQLYSGTGTQTTPDECISHAFTLKIDLETGSVIFNPNTGINY